MFVIGVMDGRQCRLRIEESHISMTLHGRVDMFNFMTKKAVLKAFRSHLGLISDPVSVDMLCERVEKFVRLLEGVHSNTIYMDCGKEVNVFFPASFTAPLGEHYKIADPHAVEWWTKWPEMNDVVESIQKMVPNFSPWLGHNDKLIGACKKAGVGV